MGIRDIGPILVPGCGRNLYFTWSLSISEHREMGVIIVLGKGGRKSGVLLCSFKLPKLICHS